MWIDGKREDACVGEEATIGTNGSTGRRWMLHSWCGRSPERWWTCQRHPMSTTHGRHVACVAMVMAANSCDPRGIPLRAAGSTTSGYGRCNSFPVHRKGWLLDRGHDDLQWEGNLSQQTIPFRPFKCPDRTGRAIDRWNSPPGPPPTSLRIAHVLEFRVPPSLSA